MWSIPINSLYVMLFILGALFIAYLIERYLKLSSIDNDYHELHMRIRSWAWMILILFACLAVSRTSAILLFAFISFLALKEYFSIVPLRLSDRETMFWAYLSIPIQYFLVHINWYGMLIIFVPVYMFLILPMRMVLKGDTRGFIKSAATIQWGVMMTVFFLGHICFLLTIPVVNQQAGHLGLILFILLATELNDVFQYLFGKLFGKHKIIPKVSPNKTWEGFIGGVVSITLISVILTPVLTPLSAKYGFIIGILVSCSGFIGDVVVSSIKRDLRIKDSGKMIPGHGGILDRFDSLIYTAPLFFHTVLYFVKRM